VDEKKALLRAHYEAIFYRDLVDRCKLDPELLDLVLSTLVSSAAGQFSASKLLNVVKSLGFKCSKSTLIRYVECARQAYLLLLSEIHSPSVRSRKQYPRKVYVVDNGIITTVYPEAAESIGKLMENAVAVELARRGYTLRYWREYGRREGGEVDFVVVRGARARMLIQVTYALEKPGVRPRELRALVKASRELEVREALVITWDFRGEEELGGLRVMYVPMWMLLLEPERYLPPR